MSWVKELLEKLLRIQDKILANQPWLEQEAEEAEGRKSILVVEDPDGGRFPLEISGRRIKWAESEDGWMHRITLSGDSFIDILKGTADIDEEIRLRHIRVEGVDSTLHMKKMRDAFTRLRHLFSLLRG